MSRRTPKWRPSPAEPVIDPWLQKWRDITTFDQRHVGPREPRTFEFRLSKQFQIFVTKGHIHNPGRWIGTFRGGLFEQVDFGEDTLPYEEAQRRCLTYARELLQALYALCTERKDGA